MKNKISKDQSPVLSIDVELQKSIQQAQEEQSLIFGADSLLPQQSLSIELEQHELESGVKFSLQGVKDLIKSNARDYEAMFPNSNPFFKHMYKLLKWDHLDPTSFIKPPVVAVFIKKYIYGRFDREVLPTLMAFDNPIISGYIKKYKLFQFLNDEGISLLKTYIKEANKVMDASKDWYDFELKYTKLYDLPVQMRILD